jgi:SNF2 family DNA or RNA helicase
MYYQMMNKLVDFACVLAMFTRLRQATIAPYLMVPESKRNFNKTKKEDKTVKYLDEITNKSDLALTCYDKRGCAGYNSSKLSKIIELFTKIPNREKVLVFSMFTSCLDLLREAVEVNPNLSDFTILQLDGDVTGEERDLIIKRFRSDDSIRALFITYKTGSQGLNLVEAKHCICIEPWWTPIVPNQAKARIWRTGQTNNVHIYTVIIKDTIEERIQEICKEKNEMASNYLDGTTKKLSKNVGLDMFTLGRILDLR